jgi:hypothetical protein
MPAQGAEGPGKGCEQDIFGVEGVFGVVVVGEVLSHLADRRQKRDV